MSEGGRSFLVTTCAYLNYSVAPSVKIKCIIIIIIIIIISIK